MSKTKVMEINLTKKGNLKVGIAEQFRDNLRMVATTVLCCAIAKEVENGKPPLGVLEMCKDIVKDAMHATGQTYFAQPVQEDENGEDNE